MKEQLELVIECRVAWLWLAAAAYLVSHRLGDRLVARAVKVRAKA